MQLKVLVQSTPNPNAKKFIVNMDVRTTGKATFSQISEAEHVPLAEELLRVDHVTAVHLFENIITITQDGRANWDELCEQIEGTLYSLLPDHDPNFPSFEEKQRAALPDELRQIEEILDADIRPYLQGDGGDLTVIGLEGSVLKISYEGACGTCPSSVAGTLHAIQGVIREKFREDIEVVTV